MSLACVDSDELLVPTNHLLPTRQCPYIHPVFNVVKLTPSPADPIAGRNSAIPPPPEVIHGEEEYLVEKILDSKMFRGRLKFKIKWEGYGPEHDSWEYATEVHAPERVQEFYRQNPAAPVRGQTSAHLPPLPLFRLSADNLPTRKSLPRSS